MEDEEIVQEEVKLELKLTGTKNKKEREEVYKLLINNFVKKNEITEEQGNKLKEDGYDMYMENDGYIIKNKAVELKKVNKNNIWNDKFYEIYDRYLG